MSDARATALACLRDGRVRVVRAMDPRVRAEVDSSRPDRRTPYRVDRWLDAADRVVWACSCGREDCAHVAAVALVTYPAESAARKAERVGADA